MDNQFQKYTVRNLSSETVARINEICAATRLPAGAIVEDAVDLLWDAMPVNDLDRVVEPE